MKFLFAKENHLKLIICIFDKKLELWMQHSKYLNQPKVILENLYNVKLAFASKKLKYLCQKFTNNEIQY
jgi:hypothetical protein